jgi:hypothetical protein
MPLIRPTSSSGSTLGRIRWKIRNISAVQRPMPRMPTSSAMMASSSIASQARHASPESKCSARSTRYSILRADRPAARMSSTLSLSTLAGVILRGSLANRSHTVCAAFTEICWPTMLRASVVKASPRVCRQASRTAGSAAS